MKNKWLAAPYTVWMIIFIILPLILVGYFAFTDKNGAFTLDNIMKAKESVNEYIFNRYTYSSILNFFNPVY